MNAQQKGSNYANDNYSFIYEPGMTRDQFAIAALNNYNENAAAFGEDPIPQGEQADFLFGARQAFRN
jgi:hypothetical protein